MTISFRLLCCCCYFIVSSLVANVKAEMIWNQEALQETTTTTTTTPDEAYNNVMPPPPASQGDYDDMQQVVMMALQSGPDVGPSYAGGMVYDAQANAVYLTGATYGGTLANNNGQTNLGLSDDLRQQALPDSSCLFGVLTLPKLRWKQVERYGHRDACTSLSLISHQQQQQQDVTIMLLGSTEDVGVEERFSAKQSGFAIELAMIGGNLQFGGVTMMEDAGNVQYPISIVRLRDDDDSVWVLSMVSEDTKVTRAFQSANQEHPDFTRGGVMKYGSNYTYILEQYSLLPTTGTMALERAVPLNDYFLYNNDESVFLSDMLQLGDDLIIVGGSTDGKSRLSIKVNSMDGSLEATPVTSLDDSDGRDSWILNSCADPNDERFFYIVGAKTVAAAGDASIESTTTAFMAKMDVDLMTTVWERQYRVKAGPNTNNDEKPSAAALDCAVVSDEPFLYVAGVVENSATIHYKGGATEAYTSAGGDDVFVSLVSTIDGTTHWIRQVGSSGDERIARGGSLSVDANKNAILFGDTNGSLFRDRANDTHPNHSDLFIMLFGFQDGAHMSPTVPTEEPPPQKDANQAPQQDKEPRIVNAGPKIMTVAPWAALALLLVLYCCCYQIRYQQRKKRVEHDTNSIFAYMQHFDLEDVDLQRSPPGGWHGIYKSKLAYGINKADFYREGDGDANSVGDHTHLTASSQSSIERHSRFMDAIGPDTMLAYK